MDRARQTARAHASRLTGEGIGGVERRLDLRARGAAVAIVALGLAARLLAARRSFVDPDETLHDWLARPDSFLELYQRSLPDAHPPLFVLLLHFWRPVVKSGWQLCLLSVAFGTAFLWAAWRWARTLFGETAALATLALLAFLPTVVLVSAELRAYPIALFFIASALAALESGLEKSSARWIALSGALFTLALLTDYLALRFWAGALAYAAIRFVRERRPAVLVRTWAVGQAAFAAVFVFLYVSQISKLRGSGIEKYAQDDWLRASYLQRGEGALRFVGRQTVSLFHFLFASPAAAAVAGSLVLFGIGVLAARRSPALILLSVPFGIAVAGGLSRLYPYGGTRHSIDLALFACAAVGVALARLGGNRIGVALVLAAVLAPAALAAGW